MKLIMTIDLGDDFVKPKDFDIATFVCDYIEWPDGTITGGSECEEVGTWEIVE